MSRIYIGKLSYDVRERHLEKFFKGYGKIREILLKNGFGFVEFDDYRDADDVVNELNGKDLLGERVTIEHAKGSPRGSDMYRDRNRGYRAPMRQGGGRRQGGGGGGGGGGGRDKRYGPPTRTEYRLIVENLSSRVSWQDLKDYMRQAGEVTFADAHKQRKNQGVVEFASLSDMKSAIDKLDDTDLSGRRIRLVEVNPRRGGGRSRSRSRSRDSRSRSRSRRRSSSRSKSRSMSRSRSRSKTPMKARSSRSNQSRSRSRSQNRSRSRSVSQRKSQNRSRSVSQSKSKNRSRSGSPQQSKSRSGSRSPRRSKSRSVEKGNRSRKSMSRSRSPSDSSDKRSPMMRSESPCIKEEDASNSADEKN